MATHETVKRYHLIINLLRRKPCSYKEIKDYLDREGELRGYQLNCSTRTFKRDRDYISMIYGIEIEYNASLKAYVLNDEIQSHVDNRIMESFDIIDTFGFSKHISNFVFFENRKSLGTENLYRIIHAIQNNFKITFWYQRFQEENGKTIDAEPYALKEFKNRWYVLAKDALKNEIKPFALDRIITLVISNSWFDKKEKPDVYKLFENCFGIFLPDDNQPVETVVLSFSPLKGKYINSLPLHTSQKILFDNEKEFRISLNIYITYDFIMELLSHGADVKVISPKILTDKMKANFVKAICNYDYSR